MTCGVPESLSWHRAVRVNWPTKSKLADPDSALSRFSKDAHSKLFPRFLRDENPARQVCQRPICDKAVRRIRNQIVETWWFKWHFLSDAAAGAPLGNAEDASDGGFNTAQVSAAAAAAVEGCTACTLATAAELKAEAGSP